jgi:Flp pilus assembly protein TadD
MNNMNKGNEYGSRAATTAVLGITAAVIFLALSFFGISTLTGAPTKTVLQKPIKNINAILDNTQSLIEAAKYKSAEALASAIVLQDPSNARAYNLLGLSLKKQNKYKEAVNAYEQALAASPQLHEARNNLAVTLEAMGRVHEAEGVYLTALRHDPTNEGIHLNLALLLEAGGRDDEALGHYYTFMHLTDDDELRALTLQKIESLK